MKRYAFIASTLLVLVVCLIGCQPEGPSPSVIVPAAASEATSEQAQYHYDHGVLVNDEGLSETMRQKYIVAIARSGDDKQVDTPFGKGTVNIRTDELGVPLTATVNPPGKPSRLSEPLRDQLLSLLVDSQMFTVIERENINAIIRELNFGESKYVNTNSQAEIGYLQGVKYIIDGAPAVNAEAMRSEPVNIPDDWVGHVGFPETGRNDLPVVFRLRMYSVETGQIVGIGEGFGRDSQEALVNSVKALTNAGIANLVVNVGTLVGSESE